jgi:hypothetical protein
LDPEPLDIKSRLRLERRSLRQIRISPVGRLIGGGLFVSIFIKKTVVMYFESSKASNRLLLYEKIKEP